MMSELVGCWDLSRYSRIVDEVPLDDDGSGIQAWLRGLDIVSLDSGHDQTGLRLLIRDGSFSERVEKFSSLMFDTQGVQVNDYQQLSNS